MLHKFTLRLPSVLKQRFSTTSSMNKNKSILLNINIVWFIAYLTTVTVAQNCRRMLRRK